MSAMYFSQRYAFKKSAIKIIESNIEQQFSLLKITALEFQLAQFDEHELFINGQLFDIIDKKLENGFVLVKVYRDLGEESFLKKTTDWFDSSKSSHSSLPKLIFKTFFNPVVLVKSLNASFFNTIVVKMNNHVLIRFLNLFIVPITPPPLV